MSDYLPGKEYDLQAWLANFLGVAGDNLAALGLTAADLTALGGASNNFGIGLSNIVDLKAQLERAITDKDTFRKDAEGDVRTLVRRIQAKAGVSDGLKAQLGVTVPSPVKNRTAPVTPADVQAMPEAAGVNTLKWSKAGNKTTTQYIILAKTLADDARVGDEAGWRIVGQTTRAKFAHTGVTPGVAMAYKVQAARADLTSLPSLPATVYGG